MVIPFPGSKAEVVVVVVVLEVEEVVETALLEEEPSSITALTVNESIGRLEIKLKNIGIEIPEYIGTSKASY